MIIDNTLLDELTNKAKLSPRLRMHHDLRDSSNDSSQRMLNALEPGTVIPIHKHDGTSEDVIVLRGCVEEVFYDETGKETERFRLEPGSSIVALHVPMGQYHTCESLASGSIILEFKNGKYDPNTTEDLLAK